MLSSVLNSQVAIQVNIAIMRAFVNMRKWKENYSELMTLVDELAQGQSIHTEYIRTIYELIEQLEKTFIKHRKALVGQPDTLELCKRGFNQINKGSEILKRVLEDPTTTLPQLE